MPKLPKVRPQKASEKPATKMPQLPVHKNMEHPEALSRVNALMKSQKIIDFATGIKAEVDHALDKGKDAEAVTTPPRIARPGKRTRPAGSRSATGSARLPRISRSPTLRTPTFSSQKKRSAALSRTTSTSLSKAIPSASSIPSATRRSRASATRFLKSAELSLVKGRDHSRRQSKPE